jgi:hypothetical protein
MAILMKINLVFLWGKIQNEGGKFEFLNYCDDSIGFSPRSIQIA